MRAAGRRCWSGALLAAALLVLTACTAEGRPEVTPSVRPSSSGADGTTPVGAASPGTASGGGGASPSGSGSAGSAGPSSPPPETVKPERPAAMDEVSVDGAVAAATYFLELYPYVYATGDLEEWEALSDPECVFCAGVGTSVRDLVLLEHTSNGGEVSIEQRSVTEQVTGVATVDLVVSQTASKELDSSGQLVSEVLGTRSLVHVVTVWEGTQWGIRGVEIDPLATERR